MELLDRHRISFVDVEVDPIRFGDDLLLRVRASSRKRRISKTWMAFTRLTARSDLLSNFFSNFEAARGIAARMVAQCRRASSARYRLKHI
jgi:hypothetical protein